MLRLDVVNDVDTRVCKLRVESGKSAEVIQAAFGYHRYISAWLYIYINMNMYDYINV